MASESAPSRILHLEEITLAAPESTLAQARALLLEYGRFVIVQPGAAKFCFESLEQEAAHLPFSYHEQGGGFILASVDQEPAGCIAWRVLPASAPVVAHACEMKRLWVRPAARGLGLGRTLADAVLARASAAGHNAVYLDTAPAPMSTAHHMYLELGFTPCAPYNDNPVEGLAYLVKFL